MNAPIASICVSDDEVKALLAGPVGVRRPSNEIAFKGRNAWSDEGDGLRMHGNVGLPLKHDAFARIFITSDFRSNANLAFQLCSSFLVQRSRTQFLPLCAKNVPD